MKLTTGDCLAVVSFINSDTSGCAPLSIAFTDKSKGPPTSCNWSFGGGAYSTTRNPVHTYSKAGKYTVSLTVNNSVETILQQNPTILLYII